jgi:hypothetical protein
LILRTFPVPAVSNVLFVRVSVVALPTRVSVAEGTVMVPEAIACAWRVVDPDVAPLSCIAEKDSDPADIDGTIRVDVVKSYRKPLYSVYT